MTSRRAARLRLLGLALAVLIAGGLVWLVLGGEIDAVQSAIARAGAWGPVVYVVLHVLLTLVPVPKNLLAGVAGALFGLAAGIACRSAPRCSAPSWGSPSPAPSGARRWPS